MKQNTSANEADLEKLKKEVENVVKDVNASEKVLQDYKKMAERDAIAVKNALNASKQAQSDAKTAEGMFKLKGLFLQTNSIDNSLLG